MSLVKWRLGPALLAVAANAQAHAHLAASVPANSSTGEAPEQVVLTVSEAARMTAMTLQRDGEVVDQAAPLPTTAAAQITVPLPKLTPGNATLRWRVLGDDGHVMSGALRRTAARCVRQS